MQSISSLLKTTQTTKLCQTKLFNTGSIHTHANCTDKEIPFLRICPLSGAKLPGFSGVSSKWFTVQFSDGLRQASRNSQTVEYLCICRAHFLRFSTGLCCLGHIMLGFLWHPSLPSTTFSSFSLSKNNQPILCPPEHKPKIKSNNSKANAFFQ